MLFLPISSVAPFLQSFEKRYQINAGQSPFGFHTEPARRVRISARLVLVSRRYDKIVAGWWRLLLRKSDVTWTLHPLSQRSALSRGGHCTRNIPKRCKSEPYNWTQHLFSHAFHTEPIKCAILSLCTLSRNECPVLKHHSPRFWFQTADAASPSLDN